MGTLAKLKDIKKLSRDEILDDLKEQAKLYGSKAIKFAAENVSHDQVALFIALFATGFAGKSITKKVVVGATVAQVVKVTLQQILDNTNQ